jgi:hypothetical protein
MDEQQPQLGGPVGSRDEEDAAHAPPVDLGQPGGLPLRVVTGGEVRDDPGDERLEGGVPAVLPGVHLAVRRDDPTEVARLVQVPDHHHSHR